MKTENVRIQHEMDKTGKSKLSGYQDLIIGQSGLWPLIKYELVMLFCSIVPGALGLVIVQIVFIPAVF